MMLCLAQFDTAWLGYIDPGTVHSVFSGLAPILAAIGSALLLL